MLYAQEDPMYTNRLIHTTMPSLYVANACRVASLPLSAKDSSSERYSHTLPLADEWRTGMVEKLSPKRPYPTQVGGTGLGRTGDITGRISGLSIFETQFGPFGADALLDQRPRFDQFKQLG
jgi:hypothetical protein